MENNSIFNLYVGPQKNTFETIMKMRKYFKDKIDKGHVFFFRVKFSLVEFKEFANLPRNTHYYYLFNRLCTKSKTADKVGRRTVIRKILGMFPPIVWTPLKISYYSSNAKNIRLSKKFLRGGICRKDLDLYGVVEKYSKVIKMLGIKSGVDEVFVPISVKLLKAYDALTTPEQRVAMTEIFLRYYLHILAVSNPKLMRSFSRKTLTPAINIKNVFVAPKTRHLSRKYNKTNNISYKRVHNFLRMFFKELYNFYHNDDKVWVFKHIYIPILEESKVERTWEEVFEEYLLKSKTYTLKGKWMFDPKKFTSLVLEYTSLISKTDVNSVESTYNLLKNFLKEYEKQNVDPSILYLSAVAWHIHTSKISRMRKKLIAKLLFGNTKNMYFAAKLFLRFIKYFYDVPKQHLKKHKELKKDPEKFRMFMKDLFKKLYKYGNLPNNIFENPEEINKVYRVSIPLKALLETTTLVKNNKDKIEDSLQTYKSYFYPLFKKYNIKKQLDKLEEEISNTIEQMPQDVKNKAEENYNELLKLSYSISRTMFFEAKDHWSFNDYYNTNLNEFRETDYRLYLARTMPKRSYIMTIYGILRWYKIYWSINQTDYLSSLLNSYWYDLYNIIKNRRLDDFVVFEPTYGRQILATMPPLLKEVKANKIDNIKKELYKFSFSELLYTFTRYIQAYYNLKIIEDIMEERLRKRMSDYDISYHKPSLNSKPSYYINNLLRYKPWVYSLKFVRQAKAILKYVNYKNTHLKNFYHQLILLLASSKYIGLADDDDWYEHFGYISQLENVFDEYLDRVYNFRTVNNKERKTILKKLGKKNIKQILIELISFIIDVIQSYRRDSGYITDDIVVDTNDRYQSIFYSSMRFFISNMLKLYTTYNTVSVRLPYDKFADMLEYFVEDPTYFGIDTALAKIIAKENNIPLPSERTELAKLLLPFYYSYFVNKNEAKR